MTSDHREPDDRGRARPPRDPADRGPAQAPRDPADRSPPPAVPRAEQQAAPPEPAPADRGGDWGRLIGGAALILVGALWLLDAAGVVELRWRVALPAALIAVGLAIIATSRRGAHGGLVTLGVLLTVLVALSSLTPVRVAGGVGERTERPTTAEEVRADYALSMGSLTVDLRDIEVSDGTRVEASVGMGQLVVRAPLDAALEVRASAGAGQVAVLDRERSGLGVDLAERFDADPGAPLLILELSVGMGQIEVSR